MNEQDSERHINAYICTKVRERRLALGISQSQLGAALGISYQQLQKYEAGKNRIGAAKLWIIAHQLGVPVSWFYPDG